MGDSIHDVAPVVVHKHALIARGAGEPTGPSRYRRGSVRLGRVERAVIRGKDDPPGECAAHGPILGQPKHGAEFSRPRLNRQCLDGRVRPKFWDWEALKAGFSRSLSVGSVF